MVKITKSLEKAQFPESKSNYKVVNWGDYNKSLVRRGAPSLWLGPKVSKGWYVAEPIQQGTQFTDRGFCCICSRWTWTWPICRLAFAANGVGIGVQQRPWTQFKRPG